jgi:hypothetical protein
MSKNEGQTPTTEKKTRQKTDPTIKAMKDLDTMFETLSPSQLSLALNWALEKHSDKTEAVKKLLK